jgi:quercetin dioxygenase-like cupin family protein
MDIPDFIKAFPALEVPIPDSIVTTSAIRSDAGLMVMFEFHQDFAMPEHHHKAQWGTVLTGQVELTIEGQARTYLPGESYTIPSGVPHAVKVTAGTKAIDIFEESDRYGLRG